MFKILDTAGTPSITAISPDYISGDLSVADTATGVYDVTIKNFKGPRGLANVQATAETISVFASCTARSYSGDDLTVTIKTENDASSATDTSVDVRIEAF
jgi:hypothetical protein